MSKTMLALACLVGSAAAMPLNIGESSVRRSLFGRISKKSYTVHHINETLTPKRCGETTFKASRGTYTYTIKKMAHTFPLEDGDCASVGYTTPWGKADMSTTQNFGKSFMGLYDFSKTKIAFFKQPTSGNTVKLPDIVGLALKNPTIVSTLTAAIKAAGLVATLQTPGPFTVFAPNDAAFRKLGSAALDTLLKPENKALLKKVLLYHVIAGKKVYSESIKDGMTAKTVTSYTVTFTVDSGTDNDAGEVKVNDAVIVSPDVLASNGVVHIIDTVLLFPGFALPGASTPATGDCTDTGKGKWGGCGEYKTSNWCKTDGTHTGHTGNGWQKSWGSLDQSALENCCQCGGGSTPPAAGGKGGPVDVAASADASTDALN